jgi:hypothetical protein
MYNMVLYLYVLIVFSLHRESFKLILTTDPLPSWFCHNALCKFEPHTGTTLSMYYLFIIYPVQLSQKELDKRIGEEED